MTRDEYKKRMKAGHDLLSHIHDRQVVEYDGKIYTSAQLMEEIMQGTVLGELALTQYITFAETGKFLRIPGETTDFVQFDDEERSSNKTSN